MLSLILKSCWSGSLPAVARGLKRLGADRRGATLIVFAAGAVALLGIAGLAVEAASWYFTKRDMQNAADMAAESGIVSYLAGDDNGDSSHATSKRQARTAAATKGYVTGSGATVSVNIPPLSGSYQGQAKAVEVIITQTPQEYFSALFLPVSPSIVARAVAAAATGPCIIGLNRTASGTVDFKNNNVSSNPKCEVVSDSSSSTGLTMGNNSTIAGPAIVVGQWSLSNGVSVGPGSQQNAALVPDPFASTVFPSEPSATAPPSGCTGGNGAVCTLSNSGGLVHYSATSVGNNGSITLTGAGVYYFDSISLGNSASLTATAGATVILDGAMSIGSGGGPTISITAPSSGATKGLALVGNPNNSFTQTFENNLSLQIEGAIYFPKQTLSFKNNMAATNNCTVIVADIVQVKNNMALDNSTCTSLGLNGVGGPALVE